MAMPRIAVLTILLFLIAGAVAPSASRTRAASDMEVTSSAPEGVGGGGDEGGGGEATAAPEQDSDDEGEEDDRKDEDSGAFARTEAPPTTMAALEAGALENEETATSKETLVEPEENAPQYRLTTHSGETCILLEMDAVVTVKYETRNKGTRELEKYVPPVADPYGFCEDDEARLVIQWRAFELRWSFSKTPGGERWYVNMVELKYDKADTLFENVSSTGEVTLSTRRPHGTMLFPTPVGRSYHCESEYTLHLNDGSSSDEASLLLRQFRMQPFMYKNDFGPSFECSPGGVTKFRDETAPIAVGSTLAIVVLITVTGYGVYRYFKIKKVQYDTME